MRNGSKYHQIVIGRAETLDFVDFEIKDVPAKVDTGAYRSAIHAEDIRVDENGKLHFRILGSHPIGGNLAKEIVVDDFSTVNISNSFGDSEERYEVKMRVKLGPRISTETFTLANRSKKNYPILIGRKMLNGRFLVDTERSSIDRVKLKETYKVNLLDDEEEIYADAQEDI